MRSKLFLLLLFVTSFSFAQQSLTTKQINRLADAGKVYGYVKFFHPFLQYKDINWDSAFAANVESILDAKNKNEYAQAMQQLLIPLDDDLTMVDITFIDNNYRIIPTGYRIEDSILYISMNDVTNDSYEKVQAAFNKINQVRGVIFDMRIPLNSHRKYTPSTAALDWWAQGLFKSDITMPSFRSVSYDNLPAEKFDYVLGANFKQTTLYTKHGVAAKDVPQIFIVDKADQVPSYAFSLQKNGKAAIIMEKEKQLLIGKTTSFYLSDSVLIKMRIAEGVNADGSLAKVFPNATYLSGEVSYALNKARENNK